MVDRQGQRTQTFISIQVGSLTHTGLCRRPDSQFDQQALKPEEAIPGSFEYLSAHYQENVESTGSAHLEQHLNLSGFATRLQASGFRPESRIEGACCQKLDGARGQGLYWPNIVTVVQLLHLIQQRARHRHGGCTDEPAHSLRAGRPS